MSPSNPIIIQIHILGFVQGVAFRLNAKRLADQLNLSGFIRNLPDGSVYIEAKGSQANLSNFIDWCNQGPKFAKVKRVSTRLLKKFSRPTTDRFSIV